MEAITLYTRDGREVTTVHVPVFNPPMEIINWGARFFVRREDGRYYEGMLWPVMATQQPPAPSP